MGHDIGTRPLSLLGLGFPTGWRAWLALGLAAVASAFLAWQAANAWRSGYEQAEPGRAGAPIQGLAIKYSATA